MNIQEITDGIYYVGVNDRTTHRFEGLWPLPLGVSYNSYIVEGDKVALIDTVHIAQSGKFLAQVADIIGQKNIDYLVINHMEPDHSGSIAAIKARYPQMKIVGNAKTAAMIAGYYGIGGDGDVLTIADGDTLDLGGKTLQFVFTPMVHWPETMMTYVAQDGVLFSGDAFGCFGALNGGVVDSRIDTEPYFPEMYRYYSNIVAKYGLFVQKAIAKFNDVKINYLCSTHGPVWHDEITRVVGIYDRLSRFEGEPGVVVAYASMYGNTEQLAETVAAELSRQGVRNIRVHNLSTTHLSYVLADVMRYNGLIIGGPTYNNGLFPEVEKLLGALKGRELKNRHVGCFGSGTWAPVSSKNIRCCLEGMKVELVGDPFDIKCAETTADKQRCQQLAAAMAQAVAQK